MISINPTTLSVYPVYDQVIIVYTYTASTIKSIVGVDVKCAVQCTREHAYDTISEWLIKFVGKPINLLLKNSIDNKMLSVFKKIVFDYNNNSY